MAHTCSPWSSRSVSSTTTDMVNYGLRQGMLDLSDEDDVYDDAYDDEQSDTDESSDDDFDSEEEEFPVGPVGSVGIRGWRRVPVRRASTTTGKVLLETRVPWTRYRDEWQELDESERSSAWVSLGDARVHCLC